MEHREFRLHKDILWSIIQSQAGSLQKALLELVMNSVDAGAQQVAIELTETTFRVSDDGKGFTSRAEIESFFETFGTPHEKGDATFGRFRMGRGQVMAFTRNNWRSGHFSMAVDIRDQGLNYLLKELPESVKGCTIEGSLYERLKPSELLTICRSLGELCKYTPIPVVLNGKLISVDLATQGWTFVDEDAYYLLKANSAQLTVYNLGVEVCNYWASQYGTGGIVVSRKQLEVNFARNDILLSKCEVWKRVAAKVRAHSRSQEGKKPQKNENYRALLATQLLAGDMEAEEFSRVFCEEKLVTDVTGKHYSFEDLADAVDSRYGKNMTLAPSVSDLKADKVHGMQLALVVSPKTMERFNTDTLSELLDQLRRAHESFSFDRYSRVTRRLSALLNQVREFADVSALIKEEHHPVDAAKLTEDEKQVLAALKEAQWQLLTGFHNLQPMRAPRELRVGQSDTAQAWTDGAQFIFINRAELKIGGVVGRALSRFVALGTLLAHEYVHTEDDSAGHVHDAEFYQAYERVTCATECIGAFADQALNRWLALRKASAKSLRAGELKELDRQQALSAA